MKRIIYFGNKGTIYSELIEEDDNFYLNCGDWIQPFPNTKEDSTAFGMEEVIMQSDDCPLKLMEEGLRRIVIKVVDDKYEQ